MCDLVVMSNCDGAVSRSVGDPGSIQLNALGGEGDAASSYGKAMVRFRRGAQAGSIMQRTLSERTRS